MTDTRQLSPEEVQRVKDAVAEEFPGWRALRTIHNNWWATRGPLDKALDAEITDTPIVSTPAELMSAIRKAIDHNKSSSLT